MHFGIDYGSKVAGTTVITYDDGKLLRQVSSQKRQDADQMILDCVQELHPTAVYIDAPLSLPMAYFGTGADYHYRVGDRMLGAMSPMFLGGLTARAMKLKSQMVRDGIPTYETYPSALIKSMDYLRDAYTKKDSRCISVMRPLLMDMIEDYDLQDPMLTMHALDSLVAWISGWRHLQGRAEVVGDEREGVIIF